MHSFYTHWFLVLHSSRIVLKHKLVKTFVILKKIMINIPCWEKNFIYLHIVQEEITSDFLVSDVIIQYSCSDQFIALRVGRNRVPNSAIFQLQYQKRGNYEEIHANESLEVYIYINNFLPTKLLQFDKTDLWSAPITFHFRFDIGDVRDQDFLISRKRNIHDWIVSLPLFLQSITRLCLHKY